MLSAFSYATLALPLLLAVALGLALPLLGLLLYSRFVLGVMYVVLVFLCDAVFVGNVRLNLGLNLYTNDLAFGLLGAVATARWCVAGDMPARSKSWLLFVLLFLVGLGLGLTQYGTRAGVQARDFFYAIVAASYFMSFTVDEHRVQQFLRVLAASAWVLLPLCVYRWTVAFWPLPDLLPPGGAWSPDGATRVITSNETLALAQLLLLGLMFPGSGQAVRPLRFAAPLLLAAVVALQHRSVWVAGLIGVVSAFALMRSASGSRAGQLLALVVVVSLTAVPAVLSERLTGVSREVGQSASTALAGQGSVHSRLEDWQQTLKEWSRAGPRAWLIGYGFGRDTTRLLLNESGERRVVRFGTHNHYIALLTNTGLLGLTAFLALVAWVLKGLYTLCLAGQAGAVAPTLLTLIIMQLAYYVPYGGDTLQHALLGLAVAFVASQRNMKLPLVSAAPAVLKKPAFA